MQCETCHGSGSVGPLPIPCGDCGGSGVAHCCDGIQAQSDPGDETPENCDEQRRRIQDKMLRNWCRKRGIEPPAPEAMGCADDCCHPDHRHNVTVADTLYCGECFEPVPDTHGEWREMNEGDDAA